LIKCPHHEQVKNGEWENECAGDQIGTMYMDKNTSESKRWKEIIENNGLKPLMKYKIYYELNFTCNSDKYTCFDLWFVEFMIWIVRNKTFQYVYRPCLCFSQCYRSNNKYGHKADTWFFSVHINEIDFWSYTQTMRK
jgi:hypothetical protein